jgi:hypothetical protein
VDCYQSPTGRIAAFITLIPYGADVANVESSTVWANGSDALVTPFGPYGGECWLSAITFYPMPVVELLVLGSAWYIRVSYGAWPTPNYIYFQLIGFDPCLTDQIVDVTVWLSGGTWTYPTKFRIQSCGCGPVVVGVSGALAWGDDVLTWGDDSLAWGTETVEVDVSKPARMSVAAPAAPSGRVLQCVSLGERVEFRAGCGGWNCLHKCDSKRADVADHLGGIMEATPGDDCQDCPGYVARTT